ncbi:adenosine deaminase [Clostridium sp. AF20-17LB]|nr:adenosine deaminase [Clostridium sp. AF20-17LB]RHR08439.1 adenosine deaminase [Clostridium sp. AF20-17LB]
MGHVTELHLHLDGSLRPETVWELAKEQGIRLPAESAEEVKYKMEVPEDCRTLEEYLERFDLPLLVLQRADAIERVTYELVEDLAKEGVDYAEIRFAPQLSVNGGLTQDEVVEAAIRGAERGMKTYPEIRVGLILCCMRRADNEALNMQTVETAKKYLGPVVCAVDIAGAEGLFPTENFAPVFAKVREYGIPMTIHAGEAAGPDSMKTALSFGTKRIGHGVAAINDPELIRRLIDENVTLEVCVTSNYHTKVVPAIEMHPIHKLLDEGVHVTVNSDNRTCSRTTLQKEKEVLKEQLGFSDEEIEKMQEYAWEARFLK